MRLQKQGTNNIRIFQVPDGQEGKYLAMALVVQSSVGLVLAIEAPSFLAGGELTGIRVITEQP